MVSNNFLWRDGDGTAAGSTVGQFHPKFDEGHTPDNKFFNVGAVVSALLALLFWYQVHSQQQEEISRRREADQRETELRQMNASIKSTAPSIEHLLQMQAAAEAQRRADASEPATQPVASNPRTAFVRQVLLQPTPASLRLSRWRPIQELRLCVQVLLQLKSPNRRSRTSQGRNGSPTRSNLPCYRMRFASAPIYIRPPAGLVLQARLAKGNYRWGSAKGMFTVNISDRTEAGFHPPIITVPGHPPTPPSQLVFIGASKEIGTIDQIPFVRAFQERGLKRILCSLRRRPTDRHFLDCKASYR